MRVSRQKAVARDVRVNRSYESNPKLQPQYAEISASVAEADPILATLNHELCLDTFARRRTISKAYWQIAAGSAGRNYADLFVKFGMAFVGGQKEIKTMAEISLGDIVLLKGGRSKIYAVGEVVRERR